MTDVRTSTPPVATIVDLGTQRLLIVEIEQKAGVTDYTLDIDLRPKQIGGGGEADDWCINNCGKQSVKLPTIPVPV